MADRKLIVEIVGDDSQFQRTLSNTKSSLQQFGRDTGTSPGGVNTRNSAGTQEFLAETDRLKRQAEDLRQQIEDVGDEALTTGDKLAKAAKIGAGFFVLGRGLEGAAKGLETFNGEATPTSRALQDAGGAIESLITLDPAGFFESVGASAERNREGLRKYADGLVDVNNAGRDLALAEGARALGFGKEADAIVAKVDELKRAEATLKALSFAARGENVTSINGQTAIVRFRGAGVAEGTGVRGPGGVQILRVSQQPINVTVELDGQKVGQAVTNVQQGQTRSNPRQKRGGGAANSPDSR